VAVRFAAPVEELGSLGLSRDHLVGLYRTMLLTRAVEDRGSALHANGRVPGSFYTGRGNEAASVGVGAAMGPDDVAAPLHRNLGVHFARGVDPATIFCQYMGRVGSSTNGRDSNLRTQDLSRGLIAGVSHLPGILPTAGGVALAFRIRGEARVALGWMGDGSSARGDAHEVMNLAGVRRLPLVFIVDDNGFAYSTPGALNYGCAHLAERAAGYGFDGVVVDGADLPLVWREARAAIEHARGGGGPRLLELRTQRLAGHAIHDDAAYVPPEILAAWSAHDPIELFGARLTAEADWTADEDRALREAVTATVADALERAEASPLPDPATQRDGVYAV
jgi:TPP-dependent pyruvate/acetoin dehydrogenase alpha subunit